MITEAFFNLLSEKAKTYKHSSMTYVEYDDCKNAEALYDRDGLILLLDKSKTPAMLYFAADDFLSLIEIISGMTGKLRLHFVPREFSARLESLGFTEWGEYTDFFNYDLAGTAAAFGSIGETEYLDKSECEEVSLLSLKCRLQSRGFEGETPEWFAEWLGENKVIIRREGTAVIGFCCVSIYNEGTTLWIREIAVNPAHQGMGTGKILMEQAICYGVQNGAVKGFLAADILNKNAIVLYEKYGFRAENTDSELQMIRE